MAYRWKRKESVTKALRRMGGERIEHALACLEQRSDAESVHCARKDIKKVRALVRLVRARIARSEFRRLKTTLREAAKGLAGPRDAFVKVQTVRTLTARFKQQLASRALRQIRSELHSETGAAIKRFGQKRTARVIVRALHRAAQTLNHLKVDGRGWNVLGPGLRAVYREGRRAYAQARVDPSPENFHAWRKRAKDLWYHVRVLQRIWPEQMEAIAAELDSLGNLLGDDHDLFVLEQDVAARALHDEREWETLDGLIAQRRRELHAHALALGARFYAEKPAAFCERLSDYWHLWRGARKTRSVPASP